MSFNKKFFTTGGIVASSPSGGITNTDNFTPFLYTGDNTTSRSLTGVGFDPDMIWVKNRDSDGENHVLADTVRGGGSIVFPNLDLAEITSTYITPATDGFNITTNNNNILNYDYVAWCWKAGGAEVTNTDGVTSGSVTAVTSTVSANQDAGFSICEFTTPSSGKPSWGHGLSQEPELIIVKNAGSTGHWLIYAPSILGQKELRFTTAQATPYTPDFISADSSKIDLGSSSFNIAGSSRHINYNFHSVNGYQKVGSYLGNNTTNVVTTGFEPRFLLIKASSHASSWYIVDSTRIDDNFLSPDLPAAEYTDAGKINFTSTGFTLTSTSYNNAGYTWIYLAIA